MGRGIVGDLPATSNDPDMIGVIVAIVIVFWIGMAIVSSVRDRQIHKKISKL